MEKPSASLGKYQEIPFHGDIESAAWNSLADSNFTERTKELRSFLGHRVTKELYSDILDIPKFYTHLSAALIPVVGLNQTEAKLNQIQKDYFDNLDVSDGQVVADKINQGMMLLEKNLNKEFLGEPVTSSGQSGPALPRAMADTGTPNPNSTSYFARTPAWLGETVVPLQSPNGINTMTGGAASLPETPKPVETALDNGAYETTVVSEPLVLTSDTTVSPDLTSNTDSKLEEPVKLEIDLTNKTERDKYYNGVRDQIQQAKELVENKLHRFNPETDSQSAWANKETYNPHRAGLQAFSNARLLYSGQFTNLEGQLQTLLTEKEKMGTEFVGETAIEMCVDKLNRIYERIQDELENVNVAIATVDEQEELAPSLNEQIVHDNDINEAELLHDAPTFVQKIIDTLDATLDAINKEFHPDKLDIVSENGIELQNLKKRLLNLRSLIIQRLKEPDDIVRNNNLKRTEKFVAEDIAKVGSLISELKSKKLVLENNNPPSLETKPPSDVLVLNNPILIPIETKESEEQSVDTVHPLETHPESQSETLQSVLDDLSTNPLVLDNRVPQARFEKIRSLFGKDLEVKLGRVALVALVGIITPKALNTDASVSPTVDTAGYATALQLPGFPSNLNRTTIEAYLKSLEEPVPASLNSIPPVIPDYQPEKLELATTDVAVPGVVLPSPISSIEINPNAPQLKPFSTKADSVPAESNMSFNDSLDYQVAPAVALKEYKINYGDTFWDINEGQTLAGKLPVLTQINPYFKQALIDRLRDKINSDPELRSRIGGIGETADNLITGAVMNLNVLNQEAGLIAIEYGYLY